MSRKCKFCFTKIIDQNENCPVCKISFNKTAKDLTPDEKKVWHAARNLYIVSFFSVLGGCIFLAGGIIYLLKYFFAGLVTLSLGIFMLALGVFLRKYKKWCYLVGIAFYSLVLLFQLVRMNLIGILFSTLFLYIIANPTAKKILYNEI